MSYLEGCTAPAYDENQLHAAVVELYAAKDAEIKYSTVQNWWVQAGELLILYFSLSLFVSGFCLLWSSLPFVEIKYSQGAELVGAGCCIAFILGLGGLNISLFYGNQVLHSAEASVYRERMVE